VPRGDVLAVQQRRRVDRLLTCGKAATPTTEQRKGVAVPSFEGTNKRDALVNNVTSPVDVRRMLDRRSMCPI
jgi:hypothetical protein